MANIASLTNRMPWARMVNGHTSNRIGYVCLARSPINFEPYHEKSSNDPHLEIQPKFPFDSYRHRRRNPIQR